MISSSSPRWFTSYAVLASMILLLIPCCVGAFQIPLQRRSMTTTTLPSPTTTTILFLAKKRGNRRSTTTGKGFSTAEPAASTTQTTKSSSQQQQVTETPGPKTSENEPQSSPVMSTTTTTTTSSFLQSVESGGSKAVPVVEEEDVPAEERTKRILREKYGMKSLEEQQLDAKQREARKEKQRKLQEWKKKAEADEEFDVMAMLPAPVIIGIDRFLKFGVGITGFLFVLAGIGITLEAWSKTTGQPLPDNIDSFIVNTVEPNFTPGLFVLLGFSVSLGIFAGLQLSSASAVYKEK